MSKLFLLLIFAIQASNAFSAISFAEYYDNRDAPFIWKVDDLYYSPGYIKFDPFIVAATLARENHAVLSPGVISGLMHPSIAFPLKDGWQPLRDAMALGSLTPLCHSSTHPTHVTNLVYSVEYIDSVTKLTDELVYPWQFTYNGNEYLNVFYQWGGCVGIDEGVAREYAANAHFLAVCIGAPNGWTDYGSTNFSSWDAGLGDIGMYEDTGLTTSMDYITTDQAGLFAWPDIAVSNRNVLILNGHSWMESNDVGGTNSALWEAFFSEEFGNRHNVWYTDPSTLYTYHYLVDQNPPTISTVSSNATSITFQVDGSGLPRSTYGLSCPVTYIVDKPVGWATNETYVVEYKDTGGWQYVTKKYPTDWYNDINCYREEGDTIIVNQGLPQTSDVFQIRIRSGRKMPAFFRSE